MLQLTGQERRQLLINVLAGVASWAIVLLVLAPIAYHFGMRLRR